VDPRVGLDDVVKRKILPLPGIELRPSAVQPVTNRYTERASRLVQVLFILFIILFYIIIYYIVYYPSSNLV
jgi:hypothetical protein